MNKKEEAIIMKSFNKSGNEIVAFVNGKELPANCMSEISPIEAQAFMIGVKADNKENIIKSLCDLGIVDEFNEEKKDLIIELAMDLLSHDGDLNFD